MKKKNGKGEEKKAFRAENYTRSEMLEVQDKFSSAIHANNRPLVGKICKNYPEIADSKDDRGDTFLELAIRSNHPEMVEELFKQGANANHKNNDGEPPLATLVEDYTRYHFDLFPNAEKPSWKVVKPFHQLPERQRNMHFENRNKIAELLIKNGADVNFMDSKGETVLYKAIQSVDAKLVKYLLDNGARIEVEGSKNIKELIDRGYESIEDSFERGREELKKYGPIVAGAQGTREGEDNLKMKLEKELKDHHQIKEHLKAAAREDIKKEAKEIGAKVKKFSLLILFRLPKCLAVAKLRKNKKERLTLKGRNLNVYSLKKISVTNLLLT